MTALNSLQSPATPGVEKRPYEPSMEEILASIRRIIADDHSLPGRVPERTVPERLADPTASPEEAVASLLDDESSFHEDRSPHIDDVPDTNQSSVSLFRLEPKPTPDAAATAEEDSSVQPPSEHQPNLGTIAAPQFASPEGPHPIAAVVHEAPDSKPDDIFEDEPLAFANTRDQDPVDADHDREFGADGEPGHREFIGKKPPSDEDFDLHAPIRDSDEENRRRDLSTAPDTLFSAATDHSVTAAFNALAATRLADNSEELLGIAREMIRPLLKSWIDDNMPSMVERMIRAEIERVARGGR